MKLHNWIEQTRARSTRNVNSLPASNELFQYSPLSLRCVAVCLAQNSCDTQMSGMESLLQADRSSAAIKTLITSALSSRSRQLIVYGQNVDSQGFFSARQCQGPPLAHLLAMSSCAERSTFQHYLRLVQMMSQHKRSSHNKRPA